MTVKEFLLSQYHVDITDKGKVSMKKYLIMALCVLSFGLVGCNQNDIDKEVEDALPAVTLVHVTRSNSSSPTITSIVCYDKHDNQTSIGYHYGDYQVPQEGKIVIEWFAGYNNDHYIESVQVGNAVEMTIEVNYTYIKIK